MTSSREKLLTAHDLIVDQYREIVSDIFSPKPDDILRFDNFDDLWPVTTRPHHFHPRGLTTVVSSKLRGDPEKDIPLFIEAVKKALNKN